MRVLVAPDKFAGTLSAEQAADAIVAGWRRHAPADDLVTAPMSDGGPGFVQALAAGLDGDLLALTVTGPYGAPVPATLLVTDQAAYVESAQACGLHLTPPDEREPERATTVGVGELVGAAVDAGARRVVVGLGGSATNDGGAGLLAALGASAAADLRAGAGGLGELTTDRRVDLGAARDRLGEVQLVAATDVDNPLLGLRGATNVFGGQKGMPDERKPVVDGLLERLAQATDRETADRPGAGAAGGLGFALLLLGAVRKPGVGMVAAALGLAEHCAAADLVLTGEGAFDHTSQTGKVVHGVARAAAQAARPCVVLAGRVDVGTRETRALGVDQAYSVSDLVGERAALGDPAGSVASLAERVARQWSG